MKRNFHYLYLLPFCLFLCAFQCDEDDFLTKEEQLQELANLKTEIETLANSSTCNESTECKYIAFGSKPCGGPWSYLIYSTSIDTDKLEEMVEVYNQKEAGFNEAYNIASDCALVSPPTSINCENNTCVAVY